jgi:type II secretory pathway component PulM
MRAGQWDVLSRGQWCPSANLISAHIFEKVKRDANMAFLSRIPGTYWRRLRATQRDVLVAAALTLLAGAVVVVALWKPPSPELHSAGEIHLIERP